MEPAPSIIDGATVLHYASLDGLSPMAATQHAVDGEVVMTFSGLAIAKYDGEPGCYLFYCDCRWQAVTDTLHGSVEQAMEQACFEFGDVRFVDRTP